MAAGRCVADDSFQRSIS
uniref:Protochlorophyllide reductase B n=1 Tax=Arundo donax TaxID=35708 RepID=A0A0A9DZ65_ARUDO